MFLLVAVFQFGGSSFSRATEIKNIWIISGLNLLYPHLLFVYKRPENNYYFPDLHHMKYEIEDGTVPNGRELRFGFDPLEFPEFSWRGYAQMTSVQVCSL